MKNTLLIVLGLIVVVIVGMMLMNRPAPEEAMTPAPQEQTVPAQVDGSTGASGSVEGMEAISGMNTTPAEVAGATKELTVDSFEFGYDMETITVSEGDTVKITLTNSGSMPHDWVVDELNAKTKQIMKGETDTITFVANKAGSYEFYCSVGKHRQQGMVGKLVVE